MTTKAEQTATKNAAPSFPKGIAVAADVLADVDLKDNDDRFTVVVAKAAQDGGGTGGGTGEDGPTLLGTGGSIGAALEALPEVFWVTYGDTLLEVPMADVERTLANWGTSHALGRIAQVDEVAAAISFLCSPRASFITGIDLRVDGGLTAALPVPLR